MNIDEAILHCEEVERIKKQESAESELQGCDRYALKCEKCAEEHRQLAEWLTELKAYRELYGEVHWSNKVDDRSGIPANCRYCSNHPINGGSGICHCILGNQTIC